MIATNNGSVPLSGSPSEPEVREALRRHEEGRLAENELQAIQDRATRQVVQAQIDAGLDLPTDGFIRRRDPVSDLTARLSGMKRGTSRERFPGIGVPYRTPVVESEIAWRGPILVEDFLFAREGCTKPLKVVLTGPFTFAKVAEDHAYGDTMSLATSLAAALNQELRALQEAGATCLQIEEPALLLHKEEFPLFTRIWEVLGRGVSATLALHLEGGDLTGIYPGITRLKRLGWLSIDAVRGRSSLDLIREMPLPERLNLGIGLIDGHSETIEAPEELAATLRGLPGLPPQDRLWIGPASDLGSLPQDIALKKLESAARTARLLERS
jgi:5-methyltetrahydropteroyltriglutamate--homocysteine methyltransferase